MIRMLPTALVTLLLMPVLVRGDVPLQINHQGLVKVEGVRFNGNSDFRFAFVNPETNLNLWTNDGTQVPGPGTPTSPVTLLVMDGIYSVRLGNSDLPGMTVIPNSTFNNDNVVLRIWFDDGTKNGVQQLAPDHPLTSTPFAFRVHDGVTQSEDQTITGSKSFTGTSSFASIDQLLTGSQVGDLFIHGASGLERLSPGSAGQVLTSQGSGLSPVWADSAVQMDQGSYLGNEVDGRIIDVAFTPDVVFIMDSLPSSNTSLTYQIFVEANMVLGSGAFSGKWAHNGDIVENGFTVGGPGSDDRGSANSDDNGHEYHWVAFKIGAPQ